MLVECCVWFPSLLSFPWRLTAAPLIVVRCLPRLRIAVAWGIGNTKKSVEECAEACRQHVPKGDCEPGSASVGHARKCISCAVAGPAVLRAGTTTGWCAAGGLLPSPPHLLTALPPCFSAHRAAGVFSRLPCNAFAFCSDEKCFEPDAHS